MQEHNLFIRPCVARAVPQTPLSLIHWLIKTLTDDLWKYLQNTFTSKVIYHNSCVPCSMLYFFSHFFLNFSFFSQSGEAIWWRICYQSHYHTVQNMLKLCQEFAHHMGDFTQGGEWLLKNIPIFSYGKIQTSINISIDGLQPTYSYQLRISSGPHNAILGHALVELV